MPIIAAITVQKFRINRPKDKKSKEESKFIPSEDPTETLKRKKLLERLKKI